MARPLKIFETPLDRINLVEASAGTGKTYAITGLYMRLVAELGLPVRDILVVTFTTAATEELRDRIRQRLVAARTAFQQDGSDDPFLQELLQRCGVERERTLRRLNNAVLAFDEAAIYTIHGFCQRVLADSAFESGAPFEVEIVADQSAILGQIVEDFWRCRVYAVRPLLAGYLVRQKLNPEKLRQEVQAHLGKPYLEVIGPGDDQDLATAEEGFKDAFKAVRDLWRNRREEVKALLLNADGLKANIYNKKKLPEWFDAMDAYLQEEGAPEPKPFDKFVNFTTTKLANSTKKGKSPPRHPFFDACQALHEACERLAVYFSQFLRILRHELLDYCNAELPRRKRRHQCQGYDDLLLNLHRALAQPRHGETLAKSVRERYRAALIDEFQDTDPVQYDIFTSIYGDSQQPVFLVGDPKQAIYSFRGADIFAYLRAKQRAGGEYTLDTNWRSDPGLIAAINALFEHHPQPFLLAEIPFHPVAAAPHDQPKLVAPDDAEAPLRFWFLERGEDGKSRNKGDANDEISTATAARISRLLNLGERGEAYIEHRGERRALVGGNIAVLVRTHRQGARIREALLELGVPSVQQSQDSVFQTTEALELERVLTAVVMPRQEHHVRAALTTELLGLSAAELDRLMDHDRDWEQLLLEFNDYHQLWREQGFIRMFRRLLVVRDGYRRLLRFRDGERRMTNVLHLAELLQEVSVNQRLGMEGLLQWLAAQRAEPARNQESQQLRLESDAELVQIVTIHRSKGLEYPIVFCPFLWDAGIGSRDSDLVGFHDPDNDYRPMLDLGSAELPQHRAWAMREALAESLRLAYVALTRAKLRCYTAWGAIRDAEKSALAWLLYRPPVVAPGDDPLEAQKEFVQGLNNETLLAGLEQVAHRVAGRVQVSPLPRTEGETYRPRRDETQTLEARVFVGQPPMGWRFTSFTALQQRRGGADLPDYDAGSRVASTGAESAQRSIFTFPQGARAGRCLHAILEQIDFTQSPPSWWATVQRLLRKYGFEPSWIDVVMPMLERVLTVPLDATGTVTLSGVGLPQRLTELEFMYRFERLAGERFREIMAANGEDWVQRLGSPSFHLPQGYMRGFMDLVFVANERVYLVDYKSNWLGPRREDYGREALGQAMAVGGYHLQYLIYTVALHRYFRWRWPGYNYERNYGGVRYLFLRGMHPRYPDSGVFATRPPAELVTALDDYLAQREVARV